MSTAFGILLLNGCYRTLSTDDVQGAWSGGKEDKHWCSTITVDGSLEYISTGMVSNGNYWAEIFVGHWQLQKGGRLYFEMEYEGYEERPNGASRKVTYLIEQVSENRLVYYDDEGETEYVNLRVENCAELKNKASAIIAKNRARN